MAQAYLAPFSRNIQRVTQRDRRQTSRAIGIGRLCIGRQPGNQRNVTSFGRWRHNRETALLPPSDLQNSSLSGLYCPVATSRRTILNRSFRYLAPILWNFLPAELRRPKDSGSPGTNILSSVTVKTQDSSLSEVLSWLL